MKNKQRFAQAILLVLILASRAAFAQTSTLTGHIEGIGGQPIIFWYDVDGEQQRDTVYATNDHFTYQPQPSDDGTINIFIGSPHFTHFWYEPGQFTVTGNTKTPHKLTFRGTPEIEILNQYQQEIGWKSSSKKKKDKAIFQFIREHPASRTAAELLYNILRAARGDNEIYQELWNALSPAMQADYFGQKAAEMIQVLLVGRVAPNFTIPDTARIDVSLADFKGRYVLLDFWGHWCAPCIKSFPKVKSLHKKYGNRLAIIGIADEGANDKDKWLNAIRKHETNWTQLSELKGGASETQQRYNITGWPTYMLLDKEGVILKRTHSLDEIERKLASLRDF